MKAFTLIEMLVVIAIMAILMTAGAIGINGVGGKNVTSAVASAESLFDEARTLAISKNVRSCVLVAKTLTKSPTENLRKILVATEEMDATGKAKDPTNDSPKWVINSRGIVLPDQVYFSQNFSKELDTAGAKTNLEEITDSSLISAKDAQKGTFFIYKFNSQGIRIPKDTKPDTKVYAATFVVGAGARNIAVPTSKPKVAGSERRDFGGFIVWRGGNTSMYHSPEQIAPELKSFKSGDEF